MNIIYYLYVSYKGTVIYISNLTLSTADKLLEKLKSIDKDFEFELTSKNDKNFDIEVLSIEGFISKFKKLKSHSVGNYIFNSIEDKNKYLTFIGKSFDELQLYQIYLGIKSKVNVDIYAKPEYDKHQMGLIRESLEKGEDVTDLLDPNKNWVEMFADQFFKNLK
jgi:hypothetical protein